MTLEGIYKATDLAQQYGMIDGAHHKQWVIDQMLRMMLGPVAYARWRKEVDAHRAYADHAPWDEGIAP